MNHIKACLAGAVASAVMGCGYPGEGEDVVSSTLTAASASTPAMSPEQAAKQTALGIKQVAVGACGAWQADPDPWFSGNVSSYSNGPNEGSGPCHGYGLYGGQYLAVEFVQRYYALRWGFPAVWSSNYPAQMCNIHPAGIQIDNLAGGAIIWHGDLAVFGWAPYGHVAVITKDNGNGSFNVVEQNTGSGGINTYWRSQTICGLWTSSNTGPH